MFQDGRAVPHRRNVVERLHAFHFRVAGWDVGFKVMVQPSRQLLPQPLSLRLNWHLFFPQEVQRLLDQPEVQRLLDPLEVQRLLDPREVQRLLDPREVQRLLDPREVQRLLDQPEVQRLLVPLEAQLLCNQRLLYQLPLNLLLFNQRLLDPLPLNLLQVDPLLLNQLLLNPQLFCVAHGISPPAAQTIQRTIAI